jgi:hypothetical protein
VEVFRLATGLRGFCGWSCLGAWFSVTPGLNKFCRGKSESRAADAGVHRHQLLDQSRAVDRFFFWHNHDRGGYAISWFEVQQANALGGPA